LFTYLYTTDIYYNPVPVLWCLHSRICRRFCYFTD